MRAQRPGMRASTRAVVAVTLLASFYLLAAAIVLGLLTVDVALPVALGKVSPGVLKVWAATALVGYPVVRVVFLTRRPRERDVEGLPLTRAEQPELWARVDRLAERTGVRGPSEMLLTPAVTAVVYEDTSLLGLFPGRRRLVIGLPLLIGLTEAELDAILAHEFGHYRNQDFPFGRITGAGHTAIEHTVATLHRRADTHRDTQEAKLRAKAERRLARGRAPSGEEPTGGVDRPLAWLFTRYGRLYARISHAVRRSQESAADHTAAQVAGRDATAAALRKLPMLDTANDLYLERYALMGLADGLLPAPGQLYGGLARMLTDPANQDDLHALRRDLPDDEPDPYASHPPIKHRVAAVEALPDDGRSTEHSRPALTLLRDADRVTAALENAHLPLAAELRRVDWPELAQLTGLAGDRADARAILTALADAGLPGTPGALLDAIDHGRAWELAAALPRSEQSAAATGRAAREFLRPQLRAALSRLTLISLTEAGLARWELSWSGPPAFRLPDGLSAGLDVALDAAVTDTPDTAPLRALLTAAGLTPAA